MFNSNDERVEDASILEVLEQHQQTSYGRHLYQQQQQQQKKEYHEQQKKLDGNEANDVIKKTKKFSDDMTKEIIKQDVGNKNIHDVIDVNNKNTSETKDVVDDTFVNEVDQSIISILVEHQHYQERQYHHESTQRVQDVSEETLSLRNLDNGKMNEKMISVEYDHRQPSNDDNEVPTSTTDWVQNSVAFSQVQPIATSRHHLHPRHEHLSSEKKKNTSSCDSHHSSDIIPGAVRVKGIVESTSFHCDDVDESKSFYQTDDMYQKFDDYDDDDDDMGAAIMTRAVRVQSMKKVKAHIVKITLEEQMDIIKYNNELSLTSHLSGSSHHINNLTTSTSKNNANEASPHGRQWFHCNRLTIVTMISFMVLIVIASVLIYIFVRNDDNNNINNYNSDPMTSTTTTTTAIPKPVLTSSPTLCPTVYTVKRTFESREELDVQIQNFLMASAALRIQQSNITTNSNNSTTNIKSDAENECFKTFEVPRFTVATTMMKNIRNQYGPIEYWDVSQITNFTSLFDRRQYCEILDYMIDIDLYRWDVTSATTMNSMFYNAFYFTSNLSMWNVSNVTDMDRLFIRAYSFDSDLSNWDTSNVKTMISMFNEARSFLGIGIENWNVKNVESMDSMFRSAESFNGNVSLWNLRNVQSFDRMFSGAKVFKGIGIEEWMQNPNINLYDTSYMFENAVSFNANLSKWDISRIMYMDYMFTNAKSFQGIGIDVWDTGNVRDFINTFQGAISFDANLSNWNMSNVYSMRGAFHKASKFTGKGIDRWVFKRLDLAYSMLSGTNISDVNLSQWDVSKATNVNRMFQNTPSFIGNGISNWNTIKFNDMNNMFEKAKLFDADLSNWNVSKVSFMEQMFANTNTFRGIGLDQWDIPPVIITSKMFCNAKGLVLDRENLTSWKDSSLDNAFSC